MHASTPALRLVGAALLLAHLHGCASPPPSERTVVLSERRVFLILPLNVAAVMPPELESLSPIIWKELELYLLAQDKELKTISREAARNLWLRSVQTARAGEKGAHAGYDDAARVLALELRKHAAFDALIAPSLFVREARIANRFARWDGVKRTVEFEGSGLRAWSLASEPLEGAAPAASLHVAVFDANGDKLHEGQGGLELLVRVEVATQDGSEQPSFQFATRTDLFANRENVREGISLAFSSFLPPLPE